MEEPTDEMLMQQLEAMRLADPEQYAELMALLQQAAGAATGTMGSAQAPGSKSIDTGDIAAAISQLRSEERTVNSINLPGGKGALTAEGVKPQPKGVRITPEAGFVVKTRLQSSPTKVFINICKHPQLAEPATKKKLDDEGNEVEGLNIPLSVGPERKGQDKAGTPAKVFDVIVNPKVVQDCIEDATGAFRDFVCHLAIQYVEQKYKLTLDSKYKLPKMTYKGDKVEDQYIQDRSQVPVIEEVSRPTRPTPTPTPRAKAEPKQLSTKSLQPSFSWVHANGDLEPMLEETMNGEPLLSLDEDIVALRFTAGGTCDSLEQITVKASAFKLSVTIEGYRPYSSLLPFCIQPSATKARLTHDDQLEVTCPVDRSPFEDGPDPGSNQWLLREALRQETAALQKQKETENVAGTPAVEDLFHLKSTDDSQDQKTSSQVDGASDELPEDRFHAKDILSQHIIQQREQSIQQKRENYEKERQELRNDPNVEFVDFGDSTPAATGTATPQKTVQQTDQNSTEQRDELRNASAAIASRVLQQEEKSEGQQPVRFSSLSSSTWTELLD